VPISRCPGQDSRRWRSEDVFEDACPHCGKAMEFWKDEPARRCRQCGKLARNLRMDLGCAKWCKFGKDCLGLTAATDKNATLHDALIEEMKRVFGTDQKRISHALEVLEYAEEILQGERGADPMVVVAAAVLHDIGIREAERKHGSAAGKYQEIEGPPIALAILNKLGVDGRRIDRVLDIIANHHSAKGRDTIEFRIIWDADRLANVPEECPGNDAERLRKHVEWMFRTDAGRGIAAAKLLGETPGRKGESQT